MSQWFHKIWPQKISPRIYAYVLKKKSMTWTITCSIWNSKASVPSILELSIHLTSISLRSREVSIMNRRWLEIKRGDFPKSLETSSLNFDTTFFLPKNELVFQSAFFGEIWTWSHLPIVFLGILKARLLQQYVSSPAHSRRFQSNLPVTYRKVTTRTNSTQQNTRDQVIWFWACDLKVTFFPFSSWMCINQDKSSQIIAYSKATHSERSRQ